MTRTVIIHGPAACGKTRHKDLIAQAFGIPATNIIDCWGDRFDKRNPPQIRDGFLHLTQTDPTHLIGDRPDVIIRAYADLRFARHAEPADELTFANPIRWSYAFDEEAENWYGAGMTREDAMAHVRSKFNDPVWIVGAHWMEPNFDLFNAEELMESISDQECWGEDGWEGMPSDEAHAELEAELANVLRRWSIKHGDLSGAMLDFVEGPEKIEPTPKPEAG